MKQILSFLMLLLSYMLCEAQVTSLTVDNQTPGWLSSKINYGDQQTIKNLSVTGYLNQTDLSFIGTLMEKHSLNGHLDLTDAVVVDTEYADEPTFSPDIEMFDLSRQVSLSRLTLPISLPNISTYLLAYVKADTLDYGSLRCNTLTPFLVLNASHPTNICPKVLILRDGVSKIDKFYKGSGPTKENLRTIILPHTIDSIGEKAFKGATNLSFINLPNNIHTIGKEAFAETSLFPDTLYLPTALKTYYTSSFPIKDGQVIELGENVELFDNQSQTITQNTTLVYAINRINPPTFKKGSYYDDKELSGCTLYVPKDGYSMYTDPHYNSSGSGSNPYSYAKIRTIYIPVENISLNHSSYNLNVGNNIKLIADIQPNNADNKSISWQSSNHDVVSVSNDGLVTAISSGKAVITAVCKDNSNIYATCEITVHQPLQSISLTPSTIKLKAGEIYEELKINFYPVTADNKNVTWQSSNPSISTVDSNGIITAIKGGESKITVISEEDQSIKAECIVSVVQPVTGVILNQNTAEITVDGTMQLVATVLPDNSTNKNVTWSSSDISVAMVSGNGIVYGIKPGQATIMVTTEDGGFSALCKITVKEGFIPISKIVLNQTTINGNIGESYHLYASILPENASNKTLVWQSDNESVASIDNDGLVKLLKSGIAVIKASATDGSEVSAECKIIANNILVKSIILSETSKEMVVGEEFQLVATIFPENATSKDIKWESTNESIATVNNQGIVKAIGQGECDIIVAACDDSETTATCKINAFNKSGLKDITIDSLERVRIYSVQGLLLFNGVYDERPYLNNGVYIVKTESGKTIKLIINRMK